uniref:Ankyrin repeat, SAM and basic leucine zipper domain-containing protein 1 n=1 Tax=Anas platyrhynchos TaxID=8839 RepID=A0A8B9ZF87_ANAPL
MMIFLRIVDVDLRNIPPFAIFFLPVLHNSTLLLELSFVWTPVLPTSDAAIVGVCNFLTVRFQTDKYTVLMAACAAHASEENILKTVELLLSRNVNPNLTCRRQMTPLRYAARKGSSRGVGLLVAHGSHINAQDEDGCSALIWAAHHGHKNVIFKLLELGADKNLQTKDEKTAAELAKINKHSEIYSLLSLAVNPSQGKYHETMKQEARYLLALIFHCFHLESDYIYSFYSALDDMEVFLHGPGLEHLIGLSKERDVYLRQLLIMQKEELMQMGVTNPVDQQKLLDAIKELQVKEVRIGDLPEVVKMEFSGNECLKFLQKLNKECSKLNVPLQTVNNHFLKNSHKIALQWAPTERYIEVCRDMVSSVERLGEEVARLKDLMEKVSHEQKNDPSQAVFPEKAPTLEKRLVKMGAITVLAFVFFFFITKLMAKKE